MSVDYRSELHVTIFFIDIIIFYQLSHIIFYNVHTNYTKYDI